MRHLIKALNRAYKKSNNINTWSSARGCLVCSRMNLAVVDVGVRMQFPSTAGI